MIEHLNQHAALLRGRTRGTATRGARAVRPRSDGERPDRVIEKTVENLPATSGWTIAAAATAADHNDVLKEFQDLGTTVGADYILYAVLEKAGFHQHDRVPFSDSGRTMTTNLVEARLRLRVIETRLGRDRRRQPCARRSANRYSPACGADGRIPCSITRQRGRRCVCWISCSRRAWWTPTRDHQSRQQRAGCGR